jgi:hypothetical protein
MGLFGGGGGSDIPAPTKQAPTRVEPDLDRARARNDVRSRQRAFAVQRPLGEANVMNRTLGA